MQKILVIGSCGAGKSTASQKISEITGVPIIHLDSHYWLPNWTRPSKEDWMKKVKKLCAQPKWVMDGNYKSTLDYRMSQADTIIFLHYPKFSCLHGIFKRRFKQDRVDKLDNCPEKIDLEFIRYVWTYNQKQAPDVLEKIKKYPEKNIHILYNRQELKKLLETIK